MRTDKLRVLAAAALVGAFLALELIHSGTIVG